MQLLKCKTPQIASPLFTLALRETVLLETNFIPSFEGDLRFCLN
jgi:hypothetical protein